MPMTVTPDRIPEYLLLLDNDGWYSNIFAGSVVGDPLMEAAALNLPAPKRERQKKEGVQEKTVTQGTKPAALASPVSTVTIMPRTSTDPLSTLQAVSLTRWLVKWKTELVDERGESLLSAWTPKHVTALLRSWGWLDDGNLPTSLGRSKGVSTAQGIRSSGEIYAYSVYSAEAAENVLAALKPYFQAHNYSVEDIELPQPKRREPKAFTVEELRALALPKLVRITITKPLSMAMWMKKLKNEVFLDEMGKPLLKGWGTKHVVALLRQWGWLGSNDLPTPLGLEKNVRVSTNYHGKRPFVVYNEEAIKHVVTKLCDYLAEQGLSHETIFLSGNDEEEEADTNTETATESETTATAEAASTPVAMSSAPIEAYSLSQCLLRWREEHPENTLLQSLSAVAIRRRLASLGWLVTDKEGNQVPSDYGKSLGLVLSSQRDPATQKTRRFALYMPPAIPLVYEQVIQLIAARRKGRRGW